MKYRRTPDRKKKKILKRRKRNGDNKEIKFSSYIKTRENIAYCLWVLRPDRRYLKVDGSGGLSISGGPGKEVRTP